MSPERIRSRVLAEWRGLPQTPFPSDTSKRIDVSLGRLMASLGLKDRLREEEVLKAWRDIVGDFIAGHAAPHRLKEGVLYVRVLQPTAHYDLDRMWKPQILEKLKKRFGARTVREIKFRMG